MYKSYYQKHKEDKFNSMISHKYSDSVSFNFEIFDVEVDLILKALELFNFNLNNCWVRDIDEDKKELRNDTIFYLYNRLLECYTGKYDVDTRIKLSKNFNSDIA